MSRIRITGLGAGLNHRSIHHLGRTICDSTTRCSLHTTIWCCDYRPCKCVAATMINFEFSDGIPKSMAGLVSGLRPTRDHWTQPNDN
eukprot:6181223-Pleurochrysis_carterae.AAC.2